jgi:hypothetical protein
MQVKSFDIPFMRIATASFAKRGEIEAATSNPVTG